MMTRSPIETSPSLTLGTLPASTLGLTAAVWGEPPEKEGDLLGSYELVKLIGEGSMGRVFLARHSRLGRQVAVKVMRPEHLRNRGLIDRFFREARSVNQINHEHIVEVDDFVEEMDSSGRLRVYCVMELLVGSNLFELLQQERLPIARAIRIARQVCEALEAAHQLGVVHRDVKPDNIFVTQREGEPDFIKVLDFGVAKLTTPIGEENLQRTVEGMIVGTPPYMAPEQAAGLGAGFTADIYALGVVLYEMLSGRVPFASEAFGQLVVQIITEDPPPLPSVTPAGERIPSELKALVMRCLDKEPSKRPQSMAELYRELEDILHGRKNRRSLRLRAVSAAGAAALMAMSLGATTLVRSSRAHSSIPPAPSSELPPALLLEQTLALTSQGNRFAADVVETAPADSAPALSPATYPAPEKARPQRSPKRLRRKLSRDGILNPFEG